MQSTSPPVLIPSLPSQKSCVAAYVVLCRNLSRAHLSTDTLKLLTSDLCSEDSSLRHTCLEGLLAVGASPLQAECLSLQVAVLVARHDVSQPNRAQAEQ